MAGTIQKLAVQIVRFVEEDATCWVECQLVDAAGHHHKIIDKVPMFTGEHLDGVSKYPQEGQVYCKVLARRTDEHGRDLVRVKTVRPTFVESTAGISEFLVRAGDLTELTDEELKWVAGARR